MGLHLERLITGGEGEGPLKCGFFYGIQIWFYGDLLFIYLVEFH